MMLGILISLFSLILVYFFCLKRKPDRRFPPGPPRWPIVENIFQVGLEPHRTMLTMKNQYGDIIGLHLGPKRTVFINSLQLIKEAFNIPALCGRPEMPFFAVQETGLFRGITGNSGKHWQEQRRFAFSYIRSGIRNGVAMESLILHEANELIKDLNEKCGISISTKSIFNLWIVNSIWSVVTGERYPATDTKISKMIQHTKKFGASTAAQGLFVYFPKLSKMFPKMSGYKSLMDNINPVVKFTKEIIDSRKKTYQDGIQRDFIDCFLEKIRNTTDKNSSFFGKTGQESLEFTLYHLFIGGLETVSITMSWVVFLLAYHPQVQEKLYNNISKNLQPGEMPSVKDRKRLPYVEAVLNEVLRFSSILPIGILHEATEDVNFHEYLIPKGTLVIANQYGVANDPDVWGDPEKFRPERFLNDDETEMFDNLEIIPFSIGRRVCPAESLARDQLFLFTMRIFQSFKVGFDPNEPTPLLTYTIGAAYSPSPHKVIFSKREF